MIIEAGSPEHLRGVHQELKLLQGLKQRQEQRQRQGQITVTELHVLKHPVRSRPTRKRSVVNRQEQQIPEIQEMNPGDKLLLLLLIIIPTGNKMQAVVRAVLLQEAKVHKCEQEKIAVVQDKMQALPVPEVAPIRKIMLILPEEVDN
jgi:hypothetical protein